MHQLSGTPGTPARQARVRRSAAFTLLEMLAVIVVLGIAGALVIPSMGQTGVLRVQAAVRTIVSDITYAQSEAIAFQEKRAIVFNTANSTYRLVEVPGDTVDPAAYTLYDPTNNTGLYIVDFMGDQFGDARITTANFDGGNTVIFDALGGPITDAGSNAPMSNGLITVTSSSSTFDIRIDAFTGRVTVTQR